MTQCLICTHNRLSYLNFDSGPNFLTAESGLIAVTLACIIWAAYLKLTIYYGEAVINKLTFQPLHFALGALATKLVSLILNLYLYAETLCQQSQCPELPSPYYPDNPLAIAWFVFTLLSWLLYVGFVACIFLEFMLLWYFIYFQGKTPVN
jgi:hypothetical protein